MKTNKKATMINATTPLTYEGGVAKRINYEQQLRRSVMACMLWENNFYEDGVDVTKRIAELIPKVDASKVAEMAVEAREKMKLRHIPLFIVREMAKHKTHKHLVSETLNKIIQRADELSEFVSIYWKDGKQPLSAQVKKGLAKAFTKFNEYSLAKYNRDSAVKLRDVLFLSHAKPTNKEQEELWKKLVSNTLEIPDTWEVAISATKGEGKKEVWERLINENKLGSLALIRNLRNFDKEGVDTKLVKTALKKMKVERVLPFRFISAARYAPALEGTIEEAMLKCVKEYEKLPGKTVLLVDVSGSMEGRLSMKSEMTRQDAATGLAILARELCEDVAVYSFSENCVRIPDRKGFALRDAIWNSQENGGTYLEKALAHIDSKETYDRIIVFTDEQAHDNVKSPKGKGYVINVACYKNGVGYKKMWQHIDGFSEACFDYIREYEKEFTT
jgi:hypothetical protein